MDIYIYIYIYFNAARTAVLALVHLPVAAAGAMAVVIRRSYQDYSAWPAYGTQAWWADVFANPAIALELFAQRFSKAGLINPLETSSADFAAGILASQYGDSAATLPSSELQNCYNQFKATLQCMRSHVGLAVTIPLHLRRSHAMRFISICQQLAVTIPQVDQKTSRGQHAHVKARIKQLAKPNVSPYIVVLPASPAQLLQAHPGVAGMLFDRDNLPAPCPLKLPLLQHLRSRIVLRAHPSASPLQPESLPANVNVVQGRSMHA